MDITLATALISSVAALLGAIVGGLATHLSTAAQHRRSAAKERDDERVRHERDAIKKCEALCVQIAGDMETARHPFHAKHDAAEDERDDRVTKAYNDLQMEALYLPEELRERVTMLGEIASESVGIGYGESWSGAGPTHYHQPYAICRSVKKEIRSITAALLKRVAAPPESRIIREYAAALSDLHESRADYYSLVEEHDERLQRRSRDLEQLKAELYQKHPELRASD